MMKPSMVLLLLCLGMVSCNSSLGGVSNAETSDFKGLQDLDACMFILLGSDGYYNRDPDGKALYDFLETNPTSPIVFDEDMKTLSLVCLANDVSLIEFDKTIFSAQMSVIKIVESDDGHKVSVHYKMDPDSLSFEVSKGTLTSSQKIKVQQSIRDYNEN